MDLNPILQSSADASKMSLRVMGVIVYSSGFIIAVAGSHGYNISQPDVQALAGGVGMVAGAFVFLVGLLRWVLIKISNTAKRSTPLD